MTCIIITAVKFVYLKYISHVELLYFYIYSIFFTKETETLQHWGYPYEYSSPALRNSKLENCSTDTHNYMSVSRTEAREEQMKRWTDESPKSKNRIAEGA